MGDIVIRAENLSKLYRIGQRERYHTLRDTLSRSFTAPFRRFRGKADRGLETEDGTIGLRSPVSGPVVRSNGPRSPVSNHNNFIWALKDVCFEVKQGEVVGIIGRNGAGKSTLLKILSRITEPTEGYAEVTGRIGSLLEVGTGFHPELTGRENVYLNGAILGMKKKEIDQKFDEIVAFAEVENFVDTTVKHYSSGMHTRLAFSVAAHLDPEILLVDEVLAVGDLAFQRKCLGKMGEVAKEGRTVLLVSHNVAAILHLTRKVMVLDGGQIVFSGSAKEAVKHYVSIMGNNRNDGTGSLNRSGAEGSGAIQFYEIVFFEADTMTPLTTLCSGQAICVRLKYRLIDPNAVGKRLKVGFGFFDLFGQTKFVVTNEAVNVDIYVARESTVEFVIPRLPLSEGRYFCSLHSAVNGVTADWVREASCVTVVKGDFYGSGKLPGGDAGTVYVPYQWIK